MERFDDLVFSLDTGLLNFAFTSAIKCILVCSCRVSLSENILLHIVQLNTTLGEAAGTGVIVVVAVDKPVAAGGGGGSNSEVLIVVFVEPELDSDPAAGAGGGVTLDPSRKCVFM